MTVRGSRCAPPAPLTWLALLALVVGTGCPPTRTDAEREALVLFPLRDDFPPPAALPGAPFDATLDDGAASTVVVQTFRGTAGHDHMVQLVTFDGRFAVRPGGAGPACTASLDAAVDDLVVDDDALRERAGFEPVSAGDRDMIREHMLAEGQLDVARFPRVTLRTTGCRALSGLSSAGYAQFEVDGVLQVHGQDHAVTVPVEVAVAGDRFAARAKFAAAHADFGLEPYRLLVYENLAPLSFALDVRGRVTAP